MEEALTDIISSNLSSTETCDSIEKELDDTNILTKENTDEVIEEITRVEEPPKYKLPALETIEIDKNKVINKFDKNEVYYLIHSDNCKLFKLFLK